MKPKLKFGQVLSIIAIILIVIQWPFILPSFIPLFIGVIIVNLFNIFLT